MKKKSFIFTLTLFIIVSCKPHSKNELSFYHWKNDTSLSAIENSYLTDLSVKEVYLRFFDIDINENKQAYPLSVVKDIDKGFSNYRVVPVVYITNRTFKSSSNIKELSKKVNKLINDMYKYHLDTLPSKIQFDCDWTASTKEKYFSFLKEFKGIYHLSATIRLHQIKYKEKTGVPPVNEGTLMVYNMGDIEDTSSNSIFSESVLKQYINKNSSYPLQLDIALPIYSWGIAKFPNSSVKILNNLSKTDIKADSSLYKQINSITYRVLTPHFLKGFYLLEGTILKVEEVDFEEVKRSKKYLHSCKKIEWNKTLLYHLDDVVLKNYKTNQLVELR